MYYTTHYPSPIGDLLLAERDQALVGLWIEGQKYFAGTLQGEQTEQADTEVLKKVKGWLDRYFRGEKPRIQELSLAPEGSAFRQEVWKLLCEIPYGEVTTYKALSEKIAANLGRDRMSAQAVGGAVAHNPISIIIPCHRVTGTDGSLTGYAGGIDRKIRLLTLEGVCMDRFYIPAKGTAL